MIDLGTPVTPKFKNSKPQRRVYVGFELPRLVDEHGPYIVGRIYTQTLSNKAKLREVVAAALGRAVTDADVRSGVTPRDLVGRSVVVSIAHVEKDDGTKRASVQRVRANTKSVQGYAAPFTYRIGEPLTDAVPEWAQTLINDSVEFRDLGKSRPQAQTPKAQAQAQPAPARDHIDEHERHVVGAESDVEEETVL
jgi:hypothetical protein